MGIMGDEMSWMGKMTSIKPNCTKSKSHSNICNKSNCNMSDRVSGKKLGLDNSKYSIDDWNISKVSDEITWIKEILQTNSNCIKNKSHNDICNKNNFVISDKVSNKKFESDNLESPQYLRKINHKQKFFDYKYFIMSKVGSCKISIYMTIQLKVIKVKLKIPQDF